MHLTVTVHCSMLISTFQSFFCVPSVQSQTGDFETSKLNILATIRPVFLTLGIRRTDIALTQKQMWREQNFFLIFTKKYLGLRPKNILPLDDEASHLSQRWKQRSWTPWSETIYSSQSRTGYTSHILITKDPITISNTTSQTLQSWSWDCNLWSWKKSEVSPYYLWLSWRAQQHWVNCW